MNSLKPLLRDILTEGLFFSGITKPGKRDNHNLTVVTFHRVLPESLRQQYPYPGICVTPEELHWFCCFFQSYYTAGSLTDIYQRWLRGERPEKPFLAITFDDGQLDNLQYGLPVLNEFDFKATFYIPVFNIDEASILWHDRIGYCARVARNNGEKSMVQTLKLAESFGIPSHLSGSFENHLVENAKRITPENRLNLIKAIEDMLETTPPDWGRLMTWDEIRLIQQKGHEIGSHSMTHKLMPQCNDIDLNYEMIDSKKRLEYELKTEIPSFCYPNGDYDMRSVEAVNKAGYQNAVTTRWGKNQRNTPKFELKRFDINTFHNWDRKQQLSIPRCAFRLSGLQSA